MINYRIYQYTSIARPPDPSETAMRVIAYLLPVVAVLGAALAWRAGLGAVGALREALLFVLALYGCWALARELDPDDTPAAFLGAGVAMLAMALVAAPGVLIVYVTLGLVRMVNRSSGLRARRSDSVVLTVVAIWLMYAMASPLYGLVAALAFMLDAHRQVLMYDSAPDLYHLLQIATGSCLLIIIMVYTTVITFRFRFQNAQG